MITTTYQISIGRAFKTTPLHPIVLIADLHDRCHGEDGRILLDKIRECRPAFIAVGGDMLRCSPDYDHTDLLSFFSSICQMAPVFCVDGNHEQHVAYDRVTFGPMYENYCAALRKVGVRLLHNASEAIEIDGVLFRIHGYVPPFEKYVKFRRQTLKRSDIVETIGLRDRDAYNILLTHNPTFAQAYFAWGADLTLAGHYHGGLIRIGDRALMSPYGFPLPRYGYGRYEKEGKIMIVTSGAGDHKIPIRIGNPHEIVKIILTGEEN